MSSRELIQRLEQAGFVCVRSKGGHHRYAHPDGRRVTVPHPKKDLGKGLVAQILKTAGLAQPGTEVRDMLFPVAINIEPGKAYGVAVPDIPGCFTAGDTLEEALGNVQEAVETLLDPGDTPPPPSDLSAWVGDPDYVGWTWALVNIDLGFLDNRVVRANLTVQRGTLREIDRAAKARGLTRSAFMVQAARREMSSI